MNLLLIHEGLLFIFFDIMSSFLLIDLSLTVSLHVTELFLRCRL